MSPVMPVALTIGDPAGIGPELSLKAALDPGLRERTAILLVGDASVIERVSTTLNLPANIMTVTDPSEVTNTAGRVHVWDVPARDVTSVQPGELSAVAGEAAVLSLQAAAELALSGRVSSIASAPVNKEAFNLAGHHFEGQTEIFANLTDTERFHTILVGGKLRVSLVSAHCSMHEAIARVNKERVEWILRQLHASLADQFGIDSPKIGVAGLNPHAGEGGVFGREEIDEVIPVTTALRAEGFDVGDPLSSDSLFDAAERGRYDAVLAMYHDQGTIPLKRYGYVTVAAGLPIVRTTAGHGTAFDIAWRGIADPGLLFRAVDLAAELGRRQHAKAAK